MAKEKIDERIYCNTNNVVPFLKRCLEKGRVPMMHGSPGIGKSAIARKVAKMGNLKLIDCRLAQYDPTDLNGFPMVDKATGRSYYAPPRQFPLEGDTLPLDDEGKPMNGWLLFLDEINSASQAVQAAAYKLVLDKMIGEHNLHGKVYIMCAGNLATDGAIVNRQGTAMQSRIIHFLVQTHNKSWMDWADLEGGIDHRVLAYLRFSANDLNNFTPDHNDFTFACERTWEFASDLVEDEATITLDDLPLIAGIVGLGVANQFIGFCQVYADLPKVKDIIADPEGIDVPERKDVLYALTTTLSKILDKSNVEPILKFVSRLDIEFQIITLQNAMARDRSMLDNKALVEWRKKVGARMVKARAAA